MLIEIYDNISGASNQEKRTGVNMESVKGKVFVIR